jgi:predicted permease
MSVADVRYAARALARMPILSVVVVISLGIGIGVNTVVFSWIQARLLQPLPGVRGGARFQLIEPRSEAGTYPGASWREYGDLRERLTSFEAIIAARMVPIYVGRSGEVERILGLLVSANYFTALGVQPAVGRFMRPDEVAQPGSAPVAVISYGLWQAKFAGSPDVLQKTVRVNGLDLAVIGVAPEKFQGTVFGLNCDAWLPATLAPLVSSGSRELEERKFRGYALMGKLRPGTSRRQAQSELDAAMRQLAQAYPESNGTVSGEVLPFAQSPRGPQRMMNTALAVLQAIMLLILLAVCGNVANLMLARASARQREIGVRLALGAGPWRIARLLFTENLLLACAGGALGAAMAVWGTKGLLVLPLVGLPIRFQTGIDALGLGFAMTLALACGALVAAAPAWYLARIDPHLAFRSGSKSAGRSPLRNLLMGVQVALALVVLIVAGLFFRSFMETRDVDPGFRREGVLLAAYDLSGRSADRAFARGLASRVQARLRSMPGVDRVAIASSVPLDIHGLPSRVFALDGVPRADGQFDEALANTVTPGYFSVMQIPIRRGRDFSDLNDESSPPQMVVNEAFVHRYLGDREPIGRGVESRGGRFVIVGVVADSLYDAFGEPPTPAIYFSYRDVPQPRGEIHLRTGGTPETAIGPAVRRALRDLDPDLPVFNLRSLTEHVETNLVFRRVPARMFAVLGPLLLVLAAIGIYAVVNYAVSLRTTEIGVRLALGATARRIIGQFVGESLSIVTAGALIGWLVAFMLALDLAPAGSVEPLVFAGVPLILMVVAALACWIPARRATRISPAVALRGD